LRFSTYDGDISPKVPVPYLNIATDSFFAGGLRIPIPIGIGIADLLLGFLCGKGVGGCAC